MNFNDAAIVSNKGNDYRIHFGYMSKDDATNIMKNFDLSEKSRIFHPISKISEKTYYQRNREKKFFF